MHGPSLPTMLARAYRGRRKVAENGCVWALQLLPSDIANVVEETCVMRDLRVNPWDEDCIAYSFDHFVQYYGSYALALSMWRKARIVVSPEGVVQSVCIVLVRTEDCTVGGWCSVSRIREESDVLRCMVDLGASELAKEGYPGSVTCHLDLYDLQPIKANVARHVLDYLQFDSDYWQHDPKLGALDYVNWLSMRRLIGSVITESTRKRWLDSRGWQRQPRSCAGPLTVAPAGAA